MEPFCLVLARDAGLIPSKMRELEEIGIPFLVVCGEDYDDPRVVRRAPIGKWDAVNFGCGRIPPEADVVVLNDVDAKIHGLERMLSAVAERSDFVYAAVRPSGGPQPKFYAIANPLNRLFNVFALGELVVVKRRLLDRLVPIPPCLAEDTYLLFKARELNYRVEFCEDSYVTTVRTSSADEEVLYKERTTLGILQALDHAKPPPLTRLFYRSLPFLAGMLMLAGEDGRAWASGIRRAMRLHIVGSNRASF